MNSTAHEVHFSTFFLSVFKFLSEKNLSKNCRTATKIYDVIDRSLVVAFLQKSEKSVQYVKRYPALEKIDLKLEGEKLSLNFQAVASKEAPLRSLKIELSEFINT